MSQKIPMSVHISMFSRGSNLEQAVTFSIGQAGGSVTAKTLAVGVMRSLKFGLLKAWLVAGLLELTLIGGGLMLAGSPADPSAKEVEQRDTEAARDAAMAGTM